MFSGVISVNATFRDSEVYSRDESLPRSVDMPYCSASTNNLEPKKIENKTIGGSEPFTPVLKRITGHAWAGSKHGDVDRSMAKQTNRLTEQKWIDP